MLFDPVTKTLNTKSKILQAHQTQTMDAIGETGSRIRETASRIDENTNASKVLEFPPANKADSLLESLSQYWVKRASCLDNVMKCLIILQLLESDQILNYS